MCAALKAIQALSPSKNHPTRPWLQGFEDSTLEWTNEVEFDGASLAAKRTLIRSPELRGIQSHMCMIACGEAEADPRGGDNILRKCLAQTLCTARGDVPRGANIGEFAGALGRALKPLVVGLGHICAFETKYRLDSRGGKADPLGLGFVVIECAEEIEKVMGGGATPATDVAVMWLDAPSTRYYIRERYAEVPSMAKSEVTTITAERLKTLQEAVSKHGANGQIFLVSHRHRNRPHCFSVTIAVMSTDKTSFDTFLRALRMTLESCSPSPLGLTQAVQVELGKSNTVGYICFFDCDQASFKTMVTQNYDALARAKTASED